MTGPVAFTRYCQDESNDDGFQWKFRCERCSTDYRSSFKQNMYSRGRGALRVLRDMFGDKVGVLNKASSAAENYSHTWGASASSAKDKAFAASVEEVQGQFELCGGCGSWVCGRICWNEPVGQCARCSPMAAHQIAQAQADARGEQIRTAAREQDWTAHLDIATPAQVNCGTCGTQSTGGKFCGSCGSAFGLNADCAGCGHAVPAGFAFCANCGSAQ